MRNTLVRAIGRRLPGRDPPDGEEPRPDGGAVVGERSTGVASILDSEFLRSLPFWLPGFLLVGLFVYGAVGWNFVISLTDWATLQPSPDYSTVGLHNYVRMLEHGQFHVAFRNTIVLLVAFTAVSLAFGLFAAILVDQGIRFENTFRTIYLLPMSLSFVVTAIFWSWMYNPTVGMVNTVLGAVQGALNVPLGLVGVEIGFLTQDWLGDPRFKMAAVIFALMWQFSGYCMVVYLAALRAIPTEHYEAAKVDGASSVRMYWRVILPQLRTATTSAAVVLMVFALKAFDFLYVLFGTNPGSSVDILSVMMFREAFDNTRWAYGAAVATVLFLMALAVIAPYLFMQYRRGEL
ncbi:carbohydrate ABC transporter permease [Salinilacihabitans rarus]|uniref:carbohydrate ABC transporter permease n=1 Tax=Salinilacihabitans rarus TaxID=2961596 RepID=UPI0020C92066|nr:sugar ABC transporter permease [Salinilacihabitans rarus]